MFTQTSHIFVSSIFYLLSNILIPICMYHVTVFLDKIVGVLPSQYHVKSVLDNFFYVTFQN